MEKIEFGTIVNTFGLNGELKILKSNNICEIKPLQDFFIDGYDCAFKCQKIVKTPKFLRLKIFGYDDINMVVQFVGCKIFVENNLVESMYDGVYLIKDLIGSKIFDKSAEIATIVDVENFGAGDILVLDMNGAECRVPFVQGFFSKIEPKNKLLVATEQFFEGLVCE